MDAAQVSSVETSVAKNDDSTPGQSKAILQLKEAYMRCMSRADPIIECASRFICCEQESISTDDEFVDLYALLKSVQDKERLDTYYEATLLRQDDQMEYVIRAISRALMCELS